MWIAPKVHADVGVHVKCHFCLILTKTRLGRQILINFLNTKFYENPFDGSRIYYTQADGHSEANRRIFPKISSGKPKVDMSSSKVA
jgi:hypothetical protein